MRVIRKKPPEPPKKPITINSPEPYIDKIEEIAAKHGVGRQDVINAIFKKALFDDPTFEIEL